mmetsp:Transcript_23941/g.38475  ORF Transcript_23941/g.38475 Transcript_23941/m.38475 type:complete len:319 (+) Transcript_23941:119-1075(+)
MCRFTAIFFLRIISLIHATFSLFILIFLFLCSFFRFLQFFLQFLLFLRFSSKTFGSHDTSRRYIARWVDHLVSIDHLFRFRHHSKTNLRRMCCALFSRRMFMVITIAIMRILFVLLLLIIIMMIELFGSNAIVASAVCFIRGALTACIAPLARLQIIERAPDRSVVAREYILLVLAAGNQLCLSFDHTSIGAKLAIRFILSINQRHLLLLVWLRRQQMLLSAIAFCQRVLELVLHRCFFGIELFECQLRHGRVALQMNRIRFSAMNITRLPCKTVHILKRDRITSVTHKIIAHIRFLGDIPGLIWIGSHRTRFWIIIR